nr:MAG TPA: hypothetical protein [Caudoviricetes sp.]
MNLRYMVSGITSGGTQGGYLRCDLMSTNR